MTKDQVYKSIPIYDEINSLEKTIRHMEQFINQKITRLIITLDSGNQLDSTDLGEQISSTLLLSILEYKKQQLINLNLKLEQI